MKHSPFRTRTTSVALLLAPVVAGVTVMYASGVAPSRWGLHLAGAFAGLIAYTTLRVLPRPAYAVVSWVVLSIALLATTLGAPGIEGVRRWHSMGPLQLHVSALAAPTLIVLAASATTTRSLLALALLGVLLVIHIAQPDAGQATAVAAAALYLAGCSLRGTQRVGVTSLHLACLVAAWRRPDPLQPVTFVEDIVSRAFLLGPAPGLAAIVALVAYVAAPLMASPRPTREGIALSAYCAGAVAATSCGAFPVPLLGFGVSPVVGALLGLAMIDRTTHETTLSSHTKLRRIPRE